MRATAIAPVHIPVMLDEVIAALRPALAGESVLVDATLGLGGHAEALLNACPQARLVGIDRDGEALALAGQRLAPFGERISLVRARFDALSKVLDNFGIASVQAILFDLGLSSLQIDETRRGFAYAKDDAPLDMRMDDRLDIDAATIVNTWSVADLARVFRDFGEEPHALRVAQAIVTMRNDNPIKSTAQLTQIVTNAMPAAVRFGSGGHPAKRVYQSLRIAVNGELEALANVLPLALDRLGLGGRIAVLSYHSLEDRLVKQAFQKASQDQAPRGLPIVPDGLLAQFSLVSRGALRPTDDEITRNPRAASARLRVIKR
ncbi:MAG: 16S rRNA (cytosine(1402)-N(4))-methyltransferase RsmH, partial [Propionibacteriaceae bacterium]|nr:16S rRNA (cytosine(1402)-N(4))-methyltransferase RsmH [Propionibacteriaceae bacterium]